MKNNIRRFISITILLGILLSIVSSCNKNSGSTDPADTSGVLSRADYASLLGSAFGMDQFKKTASYFSDVSAEDACFPFVQSGTEWGVFAAEKNFKPTDKATAKFALLSAIYAIGNITVDAPDAEASALEFAVSKGIISSTNAKELNDTIDAAFAVSMINWAVDEYNNREFVEYNNVVISDSVNYLSDIQSREVAVEDSLVSLPTEYAAYNIGDIIVTPATTMFPQGQAKKITGIKTENGKTVYETTEPELEELFDEFAFAAVVIPEPENIIPAPGVTVVSAASGLTNKNDDSKAALLANSKSNNKKAQALGDGLSVKFELNFTKGSFSVTPAWNAISAEISKLNPLGEEAGKWFSKSSTLPDKNLFGKDPYDNSKDIEAYQSGSITAAELKQRLVEKGAIYDDGSMSDRIKNDKVVPKVDSTDVSGWEKKPSYTKKFEGGYEIIGSLKIDDLVIKPEIELKKFFGIPCGIEVFRNEVSYTSEISLKFSGEITAEISVATIPIALPVPGVSLTLEVKLYFTANGEIELKVETKSNTKTEWRDGSSKKTTETTTEKTLEFSISAEAGPAFGGTLYIIGIGIIDIELKCAIRLNAGAKVKGISSIVEGTTTDKLVRQTVLTAEVKAYVPILSFSVGYKSGTLANKLGIKFKWKIIDEPGKGTIDATELTILEDTVLAVLFEDVTEFEHVDAAPTPNPDDADKRFSGICEIDSFFVSMKVGDSETIKILTLPRGYTTGDFTFTSSETGIATVGGDGTVYGLTNGTTIITVSSSDGKYSEQCVAAVYGGVDPIEFNPLPDFSYNPSV